MFDERIKAGPSVKVIHVVNLMLTEWDKNKRAIDAIASADLRVSFKNWPEQSRPFFNELANMHKLMERDYTNFVLTMAPPGDNSTISLAIRYQFAVYKLALERAIFTFSKLVPLNRQFTVEDDLEFKSKMLTFPSCPIGTLAELPHVLYTELAVRQHLNRLTPGLTRPKSKTSTHPEDVEMMSENYTPPPHVIVYENQGLNEILQICARYASLPIIPPDAVGNLITTHGFDNYVELKLQDPGLDSRRNVEAITDKRVCVICKLDSLIIGFTDIMEQDKSVRCQCVSITEPESDSYLDNITFLRANQTVRLLMLNGSSPNHEVFTSRMNQFIAAVQQTKINE
uniref:ORF3 n=1 Tax=Malaco herpesvirus 1 TaxID=3031797 RepID=A0AA48SIP1_9VIRU|nr:TPA_asm: ORF3 [Malaco herpesvirus 1]